MIDLPKPLFGELENMDEAFWDDPQCKGHLFLGNIVFLHLPKLCSRSRWDFAHCVDCARIEQH